MQPYPIAETCNPPLPSVRFFTMLSSGSVPLRSGARWRGVLRSSRWIQDSYQGRPW